VVGYYEGSFQSVIYNPHAQTVIHSLISSILAGYE